MKRPSTQSAEQANIDITPMMDVVFILLIFFVVTASFVKETGLGISRSTTSELPNPDAQMATIKLDPTGHSINGLAVSLDGIEARMAQLKATHQELTAQLISAKSIDVNTLVKAVEQIREAKVNNLAVSTY